MAQIIDGKQIAANVKAEVRAEVEKLRAQGKDRFLGTLEQKAGKCPAIRLDQRIQFMGHGEDDVIVGDPFDQFGIPFQFPFLFHGGLAAGAGPVVAGNGMDHGKTAVLTVTGVVPKGTGLAAHNGIRGLFLLHAKRRMFLFVLGVKKG